MMLTKFGSFVRHRRIDLDISLRDMARSLGVSNTFLSAVELGKKPVPTSWMKSLQEVLKLERTEMHQLEDIIRSDLASRAVQKLGNEEIEKITAALFLHQQHLTKDRISKILCLIESFGEGDKSCQL